MTTTLNPYSQKFDAPKPTQSGYQFWGITLSNIPSTIGETQISNEFKKYGAIFSTKSLSRNSMNIIFKSPKKQNSIETITREQSQYTVRPLESGQLSKLKPSIIDCANLQNPQTNIHTQITPKIYQ